MKIKFEDTRAQPSHKSKIFIRVLLWYVGPFALLYTNDVLMSPFDSEASARILLFPLTLFVSAFALLLFPISVSFGRGRQGIHDWIAGQAVPPTQSAPLPLLTIRQLVARSAGIAAIVGLVLSVGVIKIISTLGLHEPAMVLMAPTAERARLRA